MKLRSACTLLLVVNEIASQCAAFGPQVANRQAGTSFLSASKQDALFVDQTETHSSVADYYGKTLQSSDDLKTNACMTAHVANPTVNAAIKEIHPDVLARYYGCGFCTPDLLDGMTVLDLGCGAGRDVYIASQLVGPNGRVIGVDMTEEQLAVAKEHQPYHIQLCHQPLP